MILAEKKLQKNLSSTLPLTGLTNNFYFIVSLDSYLVNLFGVSLRPRVTTLSIDFCTELVAHQISAINLVYHHEGDTN